MILVTGGTGFIGSYIIRYLIDKGEEVTAIKRPNSRLHLLEGYVDRVKWVEADILDVSSLYEAFQGVDYVYHSAAYVSYEPKHANLLTKVNVEGTTNVVNIALETGVKKLLFVSSVAGIGRAKMEMTINENLEWESSKLNSNYGVSKFLAEREVWRAQAEGLDTVIINPSIVLGAGYWGEGSGNIFTNIYNGLKFYNSGSNGFVDVRDVAKIAIQLMESEITNERYILVGENCSYKALMDKIADGLGVKPPSIQANNFLSGMAWRMHKMKSAINGSKPLITKETATLTKQKITYDASKIRQALDYTFTPLDDTIKETSSKFLEAKKANVPFSTFEEPNI